MAPGEQIVVSVVYALPERQTVLRVAVPRDSTVAQTVAYAQSLGRIPERDADTKFAIFGTLVSQDRIVRDGDRIEVLRPLLIDPKEGRRQAAARTASKSR